MTLAAFGLYRAEMSTPPTIPGFAEELAKAKRDYDHALTEHDIAARRLEVAEGILKVLQRLAAFEAAPVRNSQPPAGARESDDRQSVSKARGKAPGTLSNQWRAILGRVVGDGNEAIPPDLWVIAASEVGHSLDVKSARDWLRRAASGEHGYIERIGDTYRVSDAAIERFSLRKPETASVSPAGEKESPQTATGSLWAD